VVDAQHDTLLTALHASITVIEPMEPKKEMRRGDMISRRVIPYLDGPQAKMSCLKVSKKKKGRNGLKNDPSCPLQCPATENFERHFSVISCVRAKCHCHRWWAPKLRRTIVPRDKGSGWRCLEKCLAKRSKGKTTLHENVQGSVNERTRDGWEAHLT